MNLYKCNKNRLNNIVDKNIGLSKIFYIERTNYGSEYLKCFYTLDSLDKDLELFNFDLKKRTGQSSLMLKLSVEKHRLEKKKEIKIPYFYLDPLLESKYEYDLVLDSNAKNFVFEHEVKRLENITCWKRTDDYKLVLEIMNSNDFILPSNISFIGWCKRLNLTPLHSEFLSLENNQSFLENFTALKCNRLNNLYNDECGKYSKKEDIVNNLNMQNLDNFPVLFSLIEIQRVVTNNKNFKETAWWEDSKEILKYIFTKYNKELYKEIDNPIIINTIKNLYNEKIELDEFNNWIKEERFLDKSVVNIWNDNHSFSLDIDRKSLVNNFPLSYRFNNMEIYLLNIFKEVLELKEDIKIDDILFGKKTIIINFSDKVDEKYVKEIISEIIVDLLKEKNLNDYVKDRSLFLDKINKIYLRTIVEENVFKYNKKIKF